ncbi:MAG TPA: hypothetical protein VKY25_04175 [Erysipelothrix sp.]|nr:hypothetical protein [Erysipelothrix sp.]
MRIKKYIILGFIYITMLSGLSYMLLNATNFRYGMGFGRELFLVTGSVKDNQNFSIFEKKLPDMNGEMEVIQIDEDKSLIRIEGTGDMESIFKNFRQIVANVEIFNAGTFGVINNVNQAISSMQVYFIVFFLALITIWTYRYRLIGLFFSLLTALLTFWPVYLANHFKYYLNIYSWFIVLCMFIMLLNFHKWVMNQILNSKPITIIVKNTIVLSVLSLGLGLIFWRLNHWMITGTIYLVINALLLLIMSALYQWVIPLFNNHVFNDENLNRFFIKRDGIHVPMIMNQSLMVGLVALVIVLSSILLRYTQKDMMPHSHDFSNESIMIVERSDAPSFLEIQSSLGKFNLTDHLIEYKVSEEKSTWFVFNEKAGRFTLLDASNDLVEKIDTKSFVYYLERESVNRIDLVSNVYFILTFLSLVGLMGVLKKKKHAIRFLVLGALTSLLFIFYLDIFNLPIDYAMITIVWFGLFYTFLMILLRDDIMTDNGFLNYTSSNTTTLLLVYLPILLFVIGVFGFVVQVTGLMFLSMVSAMLVSLMIKRIVSYVKL